MAVRNLLVRLGLVVGNAAAKFDPSGVAGQLLDAYGKHREKEQLRAELEDLLRLGFGRFREELADAMGELRLKVSAGVHGQVEAYLSQVQASARQAARALGDPSATTVPATVGVDDPQQLAAFLPQKPPRFTVGDSVPGLPSWKLVEPLGSGGFGEVWKAENPYSGVAAFKFFLDPTARKRFTRAEAAALAEIHGKAPTDGVVKLLAAEPEQDPPWLQFEYVAGGDLSALPERWKGLPDRERVGRVRDVIRTLAATAGHFHHLGVVHRDLKPSNVLLRLDGSLVIGDFGISKIVPAELGGLPTPANSGTATIRAYTALYASPQQKKFRPADRRDDVYALGVLWYQLLRGDLTLERPGGEGWKQALAKLGVSEGDVRLLGRCWDDEPDERPADGDVLAGVLVPSWPVALTLTDQSGDGPASTLPEGTRGATKLETEWCRQADNERLERERIERIRSEREQAQSARVRGDNLVRWKASGQPRVWVAERNGDITPADREQLLVHLRDSEFWPLDRAAVEEVVEAERAAWDAHRTAEQEERRRAELERRSQGRPAGRVRGRGLRLALFIAAYAGVVAAIAAWWLFSLFTSR